ncbi:hypothetical protein QBC39DRAFT_276929 [Podospora conica]|nr:hypothetical protein QBC39DRAFT_276929 [Schizothecium conicum]
MSTGNFKVVVIGGGPVGLTAAHALSRAGIDFVVLESRPTIVVDAGASLVLLPSGQRMLANFGLLEEVNRLSTPLDKVQRYDHQGKDIGDAHFFARMKENHGLAPRVITRLNLTTILLTSLPDKALGALHPSKKVSSITTTDTAITAHCSDGTSFTGDLLIGADGAHSLARAFISPTAHTNPFLTTFRTLSFRFPTPPFSKFFPPGTATETHGPGCAIQAFSADDACALGLYERLPEPTRERVRYSPEEEAEVVKRWAHLPVSPGLTLGEAYETRIHAVLTALEEGVVEDWSGERTVLVGDAAHKFTPSTGAGWNTGMEDVVVLVNELVRKIKAGGGVVGVVELGEVGRVYQEARVAAVVADCELAGRMTRLATWGSGLVWFMDRWIMGSEMVQKFLIDKGAQVVARTPVLEFVEGDKMEGGRVPWVEREGI